MAKIGELHSKISAVCPIDGVSVGSTSDRSTWSVSFAAGATSQQRAAADQILQSFNFDAPLVPQSVKMWQAKSALAAAGKLEAANAVIAGANNQALSIAWEYATDVSRNSAGLNAVASALGMSSADVDALFVAADAIVV